VTDESSPKKRSAAFADANDPSDENERVTINPPFDVEAYARAATAPESDTSTGRPPWGKEVPPTQKGATPTDPEMQHVKSVSSIKIPHARSPSALWMVNALVPSVPPQDDVRDVAPEVQFGVSGARGDPAEPEIEERVVEDPLAEMRERASLGDYTGALEMAELILAQHPGDIEAAACVETCRDVLEKMYSAKLGPLDRAPFVLVPRAQLRWLSIDHRAGFILSLIDGASPIEMIIDVSGMPKLDALRILQELVQQRIVSFKT
jgi:hypothetical protein